MLLKPLCLPLLYVQLFIPKSQDITQCEMKVEASPLFPSPKFSD